MKNDIRKLYRKDKKLAIRVAKVLGYKIVATQIQRDMEKDFIKPAFGKFKDLIKFFSDMKKRLDDVETKDGTKEESDEGKKLRIELDSFIKHSGTLEKKLKRFMKDFNWDYYY